MYPISIMRALTPEANARFGICKAISDNNETMVVGTNSDNAYDIDARNVGCFFNDLGGAWYCRGYLSLTDRWYQSLHTKAVAISDNGKTIVAVVFAARIGAEEAEALLLVYRQTPDYRIFPVFQTVLENVHGAQFMHPPAALAINADASKIAVSIYTPLSQNRTLFVFNADKQLRLVNKITSDAWYGETLQFNPTATELFVSRSYKAVTGCGSIVVVEPNSLQLLYVLNASVPTVNDRFGHSFSLNKRGDTLAVSVPGHITMDGQKEAVFLYSRHHPSGQWQLITAVYDFDPMPDRMFGHQVRLNSSGDLLAVSAFPVSLHTPINAGVVHIVKKQKGFWCRGESFSAPHYRINAFGYDSVFQNGSDRLYISDPSSEQHGAPSAGVIQIYDLWPVEQVLNVKVQKQEAPIRYTLLD